MIYRIFGCAFSVPLFFLFVNPRRPSSMQMLTTLFINLQVNLPKSQMPFSFPDIRLTDCWAYGLRLPPRSPPKRLSHKRRLWKVSWWSSAISSDISITSFKFLLNCSRVIVSRHRSVQWQVIPGHGLAESRSMQNLLFLFLFFYPYPNGGASNLYGGR